MIRTWRASCMSSAKQQDAPMPSQPTHAASDPGSPFAGLDLLSSAVVLVDAALAIRYLNAGAENLFAISQR